MGPCVQRFFAYETSVADAVGKPSLGRRFFVLRDKKAALIGERLFLNKINKKKILRISSHGIPYIS